MNHTTLLSATLGLPASWRIVKASISEKRQRIDIRIVTVPGTTQRCPVCGDSVTDSAEESETWYHDSFLNLQTFITVQIPHVTCSRGCGVRRVAPPWERPGSLFRKIDPQTKPA